MSEKHFRPGEEVIIRGHFVRMEDVGEGRQLAIIKTIESSHHHPRGYEFGFWLNFLERREDVIFVPMPCPEPEPEPEHRHHAVKLIIYAGPPVDV